MKPTIVFSLFALCTVAVLPAQAQTYQWKDSSGRTVISDTPPPGAGKSARTVGGSAPLERQSVDSPASEPKSTAEKEMEFRKRQQEAKEKADKTAKEQAANAEKQENCRRAQSNLTALEAGQPMATIDANGERVIMDASMREQEMAHARRVMAEACK